MFLLGSWVGSAWFLQAPPLFVLAMCDPSLRQATVVLLALLVYVEKHYIPLENLRKTLQFRPQQTSSKNLHLTAPVRCRWNLMFVVVDIAVLAIRFFIGNHFRRASLQLVRP